MENGGGKSKTTTSTTTPKSNQQRTTSKPGPVPGPQYHHKHLLPLIPLVISSTTVINSFISQNDLHLHPSQTLTLQSKLSSITLSINRLNSVIQKQQQQNPNSIPKTLKSPKSKSKNVKSPISFPAVEEFTTKPPPSPSLSPELENNSFQSDCWFQRFLSAESDQSDSRWIEAFRMTKTSFILLLQTLAPSLHNYSNFKIPPDYMLASALFRLAHGSSFKAVGIRFGINSAGACRTFYEVIRAVNERLGHFFEFSPNDLSRIIVGFGWISLPNCCGVLGFSRFGFESAGGLGGDEAILVQCLVDSEGRFLDVSAGWPSNMNPSVILNHSKLYTRVEESKDFLNGSSFEFQDGNSIPQYILGDSCCPLLPWLLTPYPNDGGGVDSENNSSSLVQVYNSVHNRGMKLVDTAFRSVRARWRLISTKWKEESIEPYPFVIVAACLLHNFLLNCSEPLPNEFMGEYDVEPDEFPVFEGKGDENAQRIRYTLALQLVMASQSV
ncbi:hypothetical protein MKX01_005239 [Papaver californicum]|nr:hypothetical protein MKX01_005239 [Papaver californicum]